MSSNISYYDASNNYVTINYDTPANIPSITISGIYIAPYNGLPIYVDNSNNYIYKDISAAIIPINYNYSLAKMCKLRYNTVVFYNNIDISGGFINKYSYLNTIQKDIITLSARIYAIPSQIDYKTLILSSNNKFDGSQTYTNYMYSNINGTTTNGVVNKGYIDNLYNNNKYQIIICIL